MARYVRGYTGERLTESIRLHVRPSLRAELLVAAADAGAANLNSYLNEFLENELLDNPATVARTRRRSPDVAALERQLHALGINLNQIAKFENSTGEREKTPGELDELLSLLKQAIRRVIAL